MLSRRLLRVKVIKALYSHFKSDDDSLIAAEKNLVFTIDKTYQLYHLLLSLITDVQRYAERRIEQGRQKKLPTRDDLHPNTKFIENRAIAQIAESTALSDYLAANKLGWGNYPEIVKKLYNNLTSSDYYKTYMEGGNGSYGEDLQLVADFYTRELEDFEPLAEAIEEQSIYWADDTGFALIMILRTLQAMRESDPAIKLLPKFKSDDDLVFAKELFRSSIVHHKEYFEYIDANTKNWELDRIAFMDRIIMLATIAELTTFPTIPVKVTLDEYIEISKYYSTPASCTFVNGVLDKIVNTMKKEGKIVKQGRGLVD